jgi:hypothetical protein
MGDRIVFPPGEPVDGKAVEGSKESILRETLVRCRDAGGVERRAPLVEAAAWRLWDARPIREFTSFKGQGHISGLYYWASGDYHVGFESLLEEAILKQLDFDETVVDVASQPCELMFANGRRHLPDFFIGLRDGRRGLIDVSTEEAAKGDRKGGLLALTEVACRAAGWLYRVETEPDPVFRANLDWVARYRSMGAGFETWADSIRQFCVLPRPFREVAELGQSPFLIPAIGHLLWRGELGFDMTAPLRETTVLWVRRRPEAVDDER